VRGLIHTGAEHRFVRAAVGLLQGESQVTVRKRWERLDEGIHRDLAGDVPSGMPAHAVRHDQQEVLIDAR
jgi:hypothetical protein